MLDTFDNDNTMLLAAVQELTSELATAQSKIAELEKGGDGTSYILYTADAENPLPYKVDNVKSKVFIEAIPRRGEIFNTPVYYDQLLDIIITPEELEGLELITYDEQGNIEPFIPTGNFEALMIYKPCNKSNTTFVESSLPVIKNINHTIILKNNGKILHYTPAG